MSQKGQNGSGVVEVICIVLVLAILGGVGYLVWHKHQTKLTMSNTSTVTSYAECLKAPSSIELETYPAICKTKDGKSFTQPTQSSASSSGVVTETFSDLPTDLKTVVLANAPCATNGQLVNEGGSVDTNKDQHYVANSAAFIVQCQTNALYAYASGKWQFIITTQEGFDCATLKQYSVPVALFDAVTPDKQCLDTSSGSFVKYQ